MYTTGKYKFTYAVDGGYDTTAVRRNGDVNALRAESGLYGKIKSGYWRTKAYFYNSERGYPGAVVRNHMRIANGIQISFSNLLSKKISVMCTVCC